MAPALDALAAHELRANIEVGLIARAPTVATMLAAQFEGLVANDALRSLPLR